MSYYGKELIPWAIRTIETKAPDDVDILIGGPQWETPENENAYGFTFFLTDTEKGYNIAKAFIIDDNSYDFWAMPWARLEHIATLEERLTYFLIDGVILWVRSEESRLRFKQLQILASERLQDTVYRYQIALLKLDEAMDLFKAMMFDENLSHTRRDLSKTAALLSDAVGLVNGIYFKRGPEEQDKILDTLTFVPDGFTDTYRKIPYAKSIQDCRSLTRDLISRTRLLLTELKPQTGVSSSSGNAQELAEWYEELVRDFRRLSVYTELGDAAKTLQWGYPLQAEIDSTVQMYGLPRMDLLDTYDPNDLSKLSQRAREVRAMLHQAVINLGGKIREYNSLDEFLNSGE